jgi:hypothetical protein
VLAFLVLSVGAFQFTRKDPPPPPSKSKEKPKAKDAAESTANQPKKYPELTDLPAKDPFEIASFVSGSNPKPVPPPVAPVHPGGTAMTDPTRNGLKTLPGPDDINWKPGGSIGEVKPIEPPKPVFGYSLVGIVQGSHPMAVFDDGKGNQQLVEVGQSIGSSATVTNISGGKVRVRFNAETLVFNVGGNTNAK